MGGSLDEDPAVGKPRWLRFGDPLVEANTQLQIVEELMGELPGLDEVVEKQRQENYVSFVKGVEEDGGYARFDVPYIAYEYRDIWGRDIAVNDNYPHMWQAFTPKDGKNQKLYEADDHCIQQVRKAGSAASSSRATLPDRRKDVIPVQDPSNTKKCSEY